MDRFPKRTAAGRGLFVFDQRVTWAIGYNLVSQPCTTVYPCHRTTESPGYVREMSALHRSL